MSALGAGIKTAAIRLVAAPGAVFLAVLTAGLAASSTARHTGFFALAAPNGNRPSVVLACPRTRAAARSSASASATVPCRKYSAQAAAAAAPVAAQAMETANASSRAEKSVEAKASGGVSATIPLPDFNAPELSRFTSPL